MQEASGTTRPVLQQSVLQQPDIDQRPLIDSHADQRSLISADEVAVRLGIDVSTVYRMAADGRLAARKIGRQWRFTPEAVGLEAVTDVDPTPRIDPRAARAAIGVAADLLGVMMVVTDLNGRPLTDVVNPCARYTAATPEQREACLDHWSTLASTSDLGCRFTPGPLGFECAVAFIRSGDRLLGMVLAGGAGTPSDDAADLHALDPAQRSEVIASLPRVAATIARNH